ncbi:hypothetical protein ACNKHS_12425 [Shigella flexneri]
MTENWRFISTTSGLRVQPIITPNASAQAGDLHRKQRRQRQLPVQHHAQGVADRKRR